MSHSRPILAALAIVALAAAPRAARAQPTPAPAPAPVATEAFLEQRVIEELAADGIVLSRLGVVLDIELVDRYILVSLIETKTSRVVASTKIDQLPADRDTAVATVTPVVANLISQIAIRGPADNTAELERLRALEETQREMMARAESDRVERARIDTAERQYREEAIRFGDEIAVVATPNFVAVGRHWKAHRGETDVPLVGIDFYRALDRPDLVRAFRRRRLVGTSLTVASVVALVVGAGVASRRPHVEADLSDCEPRGPLEPVPSCWYQAWDKAAEESDRRASSYQAGGALIMVGATVAASVGIWYLIAPHPVSEGEARRLGADHNRKLRQRLGLPVTKAPPALPAMTWAPYVSADGGGLALSGRF